MPQHPDSFQHSSKPLSVESRIVSSSPLINQDNYRFQGHDKQAEESNQQQS